MKILLVLLLIFGSVSCQRQQNLQSESDRLLSADTTAIASKQLCRNYDVPMALLKKKRQSLTNKQNCFKCVNITPIFHHPIIQPESTNIDTKYSFYFQSAYQVVLPLCIMKQGFDINLYTIEGFNRNRMVIEWALKNIGKNDQVYYSYSSINPVQIVLISKLVEPEGSLHHTYRGSKCYNKINQLHHMAKCYFMQIGQPIKAHSIAIVTNLEINKYLFSPSFQMEKSSIKKLLIFAQTLQEIQKIKFTFKNYQIKKLKLEQGQCSDLIQQIPAQGPGYYEILVSKSFIPQKANQRLKPQSTPSDALSEVQREWQKVKAEESSKVELKINKLSSNIKQCTCLSKSYIQSQKLAVSMYGTHYKYPSKSHMIQQWKSRQPIEWVRMHAQKNSKLYFQLYANGDNNNNLYSVIEIAKLIPLGKIYYVFDDEQGKQLTLAYRIQAQMKAQAISNIICIPKSSSQKISQYDLVITDNMPFIYRVKQNITASKIQLLGFFTKNHKQSMQALGKLYVDFEIRQVVAPSEQDDCAYLQYKHFFINCANPHGFYQVKAKGYVVFAYWNDQYNSLTPNRLKSVEQMIANIGVEVKIMNNRLFTQYIQKPQAPINRGYRLKTPYHRSDYFRPYAMLHYGGGYADIKHFHFSWKPYFEKLQKNPKLWGIGYGQIARQDVACHAHTGTIPCSTIRIQYRRIIGNAQYIHKKGSPYTKEWTEQLHKYMALKYEQFIIHPFTRPDDHHQKFKYPWYWGESNGIISRAQYKFLGRFSNEMPYVIMLNYRN